MQQEQQQHTKSRVERTGGVRLTKAVIESLKHGHKATDSNALPGGGKLVVRAKKTSAGLLCSFFFRYYSDGEERSLALGLYGSGEAGTLTLDAARQAAWEQSEILRKGLDPRLHRDALRREQREQQQAGTEASTARGTLRELIAAYVAHLEREGKVSAGDTRKTMELHVLKPFAELAKKPAREITSRDIAGVIAKLIKRGVQRRANIVRSMLAAAFAYGLRVDNDPMAHIESAPVQFGLTFNPVAAVPRQAKFDKAHDRVLTDAEVVAYMAAVEQLDAHPCIKGALKVAWLLAGQRPQQLLRATWSDYSNSTLTLRDGKGKGKARVHVLPMPERVAAIIEPLREHGGEGDFIFSTTAGTKPIRLETLSHAVHDVSQGAYRQGDLRRTVETRLQALGVSRDVRAQLLSHGRQGGVQAAHYERYDYMKEKAEALAEWHQHLDRLYT